ncbi:MAG TPA: hypothetical protein VLE91_01555 [Candidatus Saccharimonadales bacterium]|nr:hypothetical protein [Candidatus Saccharimonadales bacterium]
MITSSSCAKIHLIGEYSAVWGKPAILLPVNLKLTVSLTPLASLRSGNSRRSNLKQPFQKIIEKAIEKKFGKKIPPYKLQIESQIPIGSGLGSSAALSSALAKALFKMLKVKPKESDIFQVALEGEKFFHGFSSGSDLLAILSNKPMWYRKENDSLILTKILSYPTPTLYLVDSGRPFENTRQMVEFVNKNTPQTKKEAFANEQEKLTLELFSSIKDKNYTNFARIMQKAHKNLQKLGVISQKCAKMVQNIEKIGGSAKISGAGGRKNGSGMLVIYHPQPKKLLSFAAKNNWQLIKI